MQQQENKNQPEIPGLHIAVNCNACFFVCFLKNPNLLLWIKCPLGCLSVRGILMCLCSEEGKKSNEVLYLGPS